jgi:hypothetical protein
MQRMRITLLPWCVPGGCLGECLGTTWALPGGCLGAAQELPGDCLGIAWGLPEGCLGAAWVMSGHYLGDTLLPHLLHGE